MMGVRVSKVVEDDDDKATVAFARRILTLISEDPLMRPSYRTKAREHLKRLEKAVCPPTVDELRAL
jgi:hypothetical protein